VTCLLFEKASAQAVDDWAACIDELDHDSILWIDLDRPDLREVDSIVETLGLTPESRERLESEGSRPFCGDFGDYIHVSVLVPRRGAENRVELVKVECLVSERWVVTVHDGPIVVFDEFRERASGSGQVGLLEGPEFLADLLEWALTAYLAAFESVELALEEFDTRAMSGGDDKQEDELRRLVELRQDIGRLRRALVSHREPLLALTRPELEAVTSSDHAERFQGLQKRLEEVLQAARDSRDSVFGSFDVLIARNEQRTNEIVKVLTLGSMLLLPGTLIAGVLGMNFKVGLFDRAELFWAVVAGIVALGAATVVAARMRRWI
jgi:magnesium transporter